MDKDLVSIVLNIVLVISLYLSYLQKRTLSDQLANLLIEYKILENELKNIDKRDKVKAIRLINKRYKLGLKNATKIFESLE